MKSFSVVWRVLLDKIAGGGMPFLPPCVERIVATQVLFNTHGRDGGPMNVFSLVRMFRSPVFNVDIFILKSAHPTYFIKKPGYCSPRVSIESISPGQWNSFSLLRTLLPQHLEIQFM